MGTRARENQRVASRAEFQSLLDTAEHSQRALSKVYASLAVRPSATLEAEATALRLARDEALVIWGQAALAWRLQGGHVRLYDAVPTPTTTELDAPVVRILPAASPPSEPAPPTTVGEPTPLDPPPSTEAFVMGPNWGPTPTDGPAFDVEQVQAYAERLGEPTDDLDYDAFMAEAAALHAVVAKVDTWPRFPRGVQQALTGLLGSRMRRLQDESPRGVQVIIEKQVGADFTRLTQFSNEHQPGWVNGLSRNHTPAGGSWLDDAIQWWRTLRAELGGFAAEVDRATLNPEVALRELEAALAVQAPGSEIRRVVLRALKADVSPEDPRLVRPLVPHLDALAGDKALKRVRRAVRQEARRAGHDVPPTMTTMATIDAGLPDEWPYFSLTEGRRAVMVGGEVREVRRRQIEAAFRFESLEWISGYDIRQIQSLSQRASTGGSVEFVLLLARFISHKVTDILVPTLKTSDVPWVMVQQGYGINQLRTAVERYLTVEPT